MMMFKRSVLTTTFSFLLLSLAPQFTTECFASKTKIKIIGGGHLGLVEAYTSFIMAERKNQEVCIDVFEQNPNPKKTTVANIWNSHTINEIASVVPPPTELKEKLKIDFDKGGIRVNDVPGISESQCTQEFVNSVSVAGEDLEAQAIRDSVLLKMGRAGMNLWRKMYDEGDEALKEVFRKSNFNPCVEVTADENRLGKGYRIDLMYGIPDARKEALKLKESHVNLGYKYCDILTPDEVIERDPSLIDFCNAHSEGAPGERQWKDDSIAIWRPGGCLDTETFIPLFIDYLEKRMGKYINKKGKERDRFRIHYNKKVTKVLFRDQDSGANVIKGLEFEDRTQVTDKKSSSKYVFCPGSVGTLKGLGFDEPAYAGFAGASLRLEVPLTPELMDKFKTYNHYMEVHKPGVVLAWQGRLRDGKIFLGGAGTKAFYGDIKPTLAEEFARKNNLKQLKMFSEVVPQIVNAAFGEDIVSEDLTEEKMNWLVEKGIATRWVGRRAVVYDGMPTLGWVYQDGKLITNGRCTTHLGSGGGSFAFIAALISGVVFNPEILELLESVELDNSFIQEVLTLTDARRKAFSSIN